MGDDGKETERLRQQQTDMKNMKRKDKAEPLQ